MNEKEKLLFGFGTSEEQCEAETFETIDALLEYAQASWYKKYGNPSDEDCDYNWRIYVGTAHMIQPLDFAPSLDDIADQMTEKFYDETNSDDSDVLICERKEAEEKWKAFINEHFDIPCTMVCDWFGLYDLKAHKWAERYAGFSDYVKEGEL